MILAKRSVTQNKVSQTTVWLLIYIHSWCAFLSIINFRVYSELCRMQDYTLLGPTSNVTMFRLFMS